MKDSIASIRSTAMGILKAIRACAVVAGLKRNANAM
jgi:hypothetical protein